MSWCPEFEFRETLLGADGWWVAASQPSDAQPATVATAVGWVHQPGPPAEVLWHVLEEARGDGTGTVADPDQVSLLAGLAGLAGTPVDLRLLAGGSAGTVPPPLLLLGRSRAAASMAGHLGPSVAAALPSAVVATALLRRALAAAGHAVAGGGEWPPEGFRVEQGLVAEYASAAGRRLAGVADQLGREPAPRRLLLQLRLAAMQLPASSFAAFAAELGATAEAEIGAVLSAVKSECDGPAMAVHASAVGLKLALRVEPGGTAGGEEQEEEQEEEEEEEEVTGEGAAEMAEKKKHRWEEALELHTATVEEAARAERRRGRRMATGGVTNQA